MGSNNSTPKVEVVKKNGKVTSVKSDGPPPDTHKSAVNNSASAMPIVSASAMPIVSASAMPIVSASAPTNGIILEGKFKNEAGYAIARNFDDYSVGRFESPNRIKNIIIYPNVRIKLVCYLFTRDICFTNFGNSPIEISLTNRDYVSKKIIYQILPLKKIEKIKVKIPIMKNSGKENYDPFIYVDGYKIDNNSDFSSFEYILSSSLNYSETNNRNLPNITDSADRTRCLMSVPQIHSKTMYEMVKNYDNEKNKLYNWTLLFTSNRQGDEEVPKDLINYCNIFEKSAVDGEFINSTTGVVNKMAPHTIYFKNKYLQSINTPITYNNKLLNLINKADSEKFTTTNCSSKTIILSILIVLIVFIFIFIIYKFSSRNSLTHYKTCPVY